MSIIFYSMGSCGYCKKAEQLLAQEIASGKIIKKDASESPNGKFQGFPAFLHTETGKTHMGLPQSFEDLLAKLEVVENFCNTNFHPRQDLLKHMGAGIL